MGSGAPHVLLVEDEANIVSSLTFVLERAGYLVEVTDRGLDALRRLELDPPSVLILDLMLPDISGYEVCRRIREGPNPSTPILMLTARAQASEHARGIAVGADVYLTKPFRIAELLEAVAALIQAKPRGDSRPA